MSESEVKEKEIDTVKQLTNWMREFKEQKEVQAKRVKKIMANHQNKTNALENELVDKAKIIKEVMKAEDKIGKELDSAILAQNAMAAEVDALNSKITENKKNTLEQAKNINRKFKEQEQEMVERIGALEAEIEQLKTENIEIRETSAMEDEKARNKIQKSEDEKKELTNFTLEFEGGEVACLKVILAGASPVLAAMFRNEHQEAAEGRAVLQVPVAIGKAFVR